MANEHSQFTPFIHLSTTVIQAGADMIENIGAVSTARRYEERFLGEIRCMDMSDMKTLRKAVTRAANALRSYDALVASGLEKVTREQFDAAAKEAS